MVPLLPASRDGDNGISSDTLRRPPTAQTYYLEDVGIFLKSPMPEYYDAEYPRPLPSSISPSIPSSPEFPHHSSNPLSYTPPISSLYLNSTPERGKDEIVRPFFNADGYSSLPRNIADVYSGSEPSPPTTAESEVPGAFHVDRTDTDLTAIHRTTGDDSSIQEEPERHVDYLSHEWREEDIWASWRYVVSRRRRYSNGVRLENASWRMWAKSKYNLRAVSPETLNWLKDSDVTWLYGPLKTDSKLLPTYNNSPLPSRLSSANSFLDRKSILKKKTASEAILQRSLSRRMLLKHAAAILQARKADYTWGGPNLERKPSEVTVSLGRSLEHSVGSASGTPTKSISSGSISLSEKRHIRFNSEVVQCIAVEAKDDEDHDSHPSFFCLNQEEDAESDDSVVIMRQFSPEAPICNRKTPQSCFSGESKIIAPLPSTTLKYRGETPEPGWNQRNQRVSFLNSGRLSPSSPVETLSHPRPEASSLLDDKNEVEASWKSNRAGYDFTRDRPWFVNRGDDELENGGELHLTSSGMFMPYDEGESSYTGIFGRVVDSINTARDITHVIWILGWQR